MHHAGILLLRTLPFDALYRKPRMTFSNVYIGVAGWSHPHWKDLLPEPAAPAAHADICALSAMFNLIEVTSSFLHPPDAKTTEQWLEQVRGHERLRFTVRVWQKLVRERSPSWRTDAETVKRGLLPLQKSRRLGAAIFSFPSSFQYSSSNEEWLWRLLDAFAGWPVVIETPQSSWQQSALWPRLPALGAAAAFIDQPQRRETFEQLDFSRTAYLRFNGRNQQNWLASSTGRGERFDYLYSAEEIAQLAAAVRRLSKRAQSCYAVFHNHPRGQALANALQLNFALTGRRANVPSNLRRNFPELETLATKPAQCH